MVISSLVTSPVEDQLNHCEIPEHTHTRHQAGQPRAACGVYATEGEEGGESSLQARTAGGRSIDIVMLITPHIYRSSESIGGGRGLSRSVAVGGVKEERMGWDRSIFSHLVKYLGGTSVECSSSASSAAASIWVGCVCVPQSIVLVPQYRRSHSLSLSPSLML